ncbi:DUF4962 domain-containing protein [Tamlana fucoidanivorans]|uniref:DUF4962 domain-containing protein n=1 Tax=Allotamlana fucoidanivorans TaxID=2583814 RepID=A0A5C4SQV1_9FLAO|nr:DUF4962 domain-containing protein [Tamlana fucoidanivorans]TNJ46017.1 DUF4962 domain-containing protein [Tamlana fucoidanivorans]
MLKYLPLYLILIFLIGCKDSSKLNSHINSGKTVETSSNFDKDQLPSATKFLSLDCLRPKGNRTYPYPIAGQKLISNPPSLMWPMSDYTFPDGFPYTPDFKKVDEFDTYSVQISRDSSFLSNNTITIENLILPMYNPHKSFSKGKWFWRYMVNNGKERVWSRTYSFTVEEDLIVLESPNSEEAYDVIPTKHPRIVMLPSLTEVNKDQMNLINSIIASGNSALKKYNSDFIVKGEPIPADATQQEIEQIERFRLKYEVGNKCDAIKSLVLSYAIKNDIKYLTKARYFANTILELNPVEVYKKSDFSGATAMSTLAHVYDNAFTLLSNKERKLYETFIAGTGIQIMSHLMQSNVGSEDGILFAHFFQHTYYDFFQSAIIMKNHLKEAEKWIKTLYDIWLSRTPGGGTLTDGAWPNGNIGYVHVNMDSWVNNYLLFKEMFGVNTFNHPWFQNCSKGLAYLVPPNSSGDGFGDGLERIKKINSKRAEFAYILGQEINDPFAIQYAYKLSGQDTSKEFKFSNNSFKEYRLRQHPKKIENTNSTNINQSALFRETGIVAMHTDVFNEDNNLFVAFKSSPFGVGSHGHADQNSFNISYKGKPIFYPRGYRITTRDKHYLLEQKHTKAKNTILVDGKSQGYDYNSYGWIPRYLTGNEITYALGDASKAYRKFDKSAINWITVLKNSDAYTDENGFILDESDDPRLKLFRRHIAFLRPSTVIIYDELESEKPITWTFQLQGRESANFFLAENKTTLISNAKWAKSTANVFGSLNLTYQLNDKYDIQPVDWLNPQRGRPAIKFDDKQYRFVAQNKIKSKKMRFLAILQIDEEKDNLNKIIQLKDNVPIELNDYKIYAELDVNKPSRLEVKSKYSDSYLLYGENIDKSYNYKRNYYNSTILFESKKGWQEAIDMYPDIVPNLDVR